MTNKKSRFVFLTISVTMALLVVLLLTNGLDAMTASATDHGETIQRLSPVSHTSSTLLSSGPAPTMCLTTTTFVPSPQDLGLDGYFSGPEFKIELADLDGDGAIDLIQSGLFGGMSSVWLNDGSGNFRYHHQMVFTGYQASIAVGDIDGDSDLDLIATGANSNSSFTYLNNGAGFFYSGPKAPIESDNATDIYLIDLDNDNDLDAFVAYSSTTHMDEILWNNGTGNFTDSTFLPGSNHTVAAAIADLDGDMLPDIVVARRYLDTQLWFNQGNGNFSLQPQTLNATASIVAGDVNGDEHIDLIFNEYEVWLNDGLGQFSLVPIDSLNDTDQPRGFGRYGTQLKLGDINGDNFIDLVQAVYSLDSSPDYGILAYYFGDGQGHFCLAHFQDTRPATDLALADLDDDDDLDIALALNIYTYDSGGPQDLGGPVQRIWINNGTVEPIVVERVINSGPIVPGDPVHIETLLSSGTDVSVDWNLGNNIHNNRLNPLIESGYFSEAGAYTVVVTLSNDLGSVTTETVIIVDETISPTISLSHPKYARPFVEVPFVVERNAIAIAGLNLGDGNYSYVNRAYITVSHAYSQTGVFTVTTEGSAVVTSQITITDTLLWGLAIEGEPMLQTGQPASFTATLQGGSPTTYTWDMGDGTMQSGMQITHTYNSSGFFTITLTVSDGLTTLETSLPVTVSLRRSYLPIMFAALPPD